MLVLAGCERTRPVVTVVRCPAAPPSGIDCERCLDFSTLDESDRPKTPDELAAAYPAAFLDMLAASYLESLAAREECRVINDSCWRRNDVWQSSWEEGCEEVE